MMLDDGGFQLGDRDAQCVLALRAFVGRTGAQVVPVGPAVLLSRVPRR